MQNITKLQKPLSKPCDLISFWNSTKRKSARLEILQHELCPPELIIKSLTIFKAREVLSFEPILKKYSNINPQTYEELFLKDCLNFLVLRPFIRTGTIYGIKYVKPSLMNLAHYLQASCVDIRFNENVKLRCLSLISSKTILREFLNKNQSFLNELLDTQYLSSSRVATLFYFYYMGALSDSEFCNCIQKMSSFSQIYGGHTDLFKSEYAYKFLIKLANSTLSTEVQSKVTTLLKESIIPFSLYSDMVVETICSINPKIALIYF